MSHLAIGSIHVVGGIVLEVCAQAIVQTRRLHESIQVVVAEEIVLLESRRRAETTGSVPQSSWMGQTHATTSSAMLFKRWRNLSQQSDHKKEPLLRTIRTQSKTEEPLWRAAMAVKTQHHQVPPKPAHTAVRILSILPDFTRHAGGGGPTRQLV